ncbi:MAG: T9SS type A sorting domain-containing protein, partial [Candidatus Eisenbacteria bacterium]|nr:T9SS type A sorting domain-containing protein [Candidatus Eisenbacteria bacterium]
NRSVPTEIYYPADAAGDDVPVASPPPGGFRAVSFGHGYSMGWDLYDYIRNGLVPEGYIVAYPKTEQVLFPDHLDLGLDLAFVLREIRDEGADPASIFYGSVGQKSAVMGHSMGGGASFLGAADDPTVSAIANLAAAETNPSAITAAAGITAPALIFSGGNDCVTPPADHQIPMYDALASGCKTRISLDGASHCQFAEYSWACSFGEGGCPDPTISRAEQQALVMSFLGPWLDYALKDDPYGWLDFASLLESTAGIAYEQDCVPTGVDDWLTDGGETGANALGLSPAFPNPAPGGSRVRYTLAQPARVSAIVYTLSGRVVTKLLDRERPAGSHELLWDGRDDEGHRVGSGVYCFRVEAGGETERSAVVVLR